GSLRFSNDSDAEPAFQRLVGTNSSVSPSGYQKWESILEALGKLVRVPDPARKQAESDDVRRKGLSLVYDPIEIVIEVTRGGIDDPNFTAARQQRCCNIL